MNVICDALLVTDRTISVNRQDIAFQNKKENIYLLIDVAVPDVSNLMLKEAEKLNKYKDLAIEKDRGM